MEDKNKKKMREEREGSIRLFGPTSCVPPTIFSTYKFSVIIIKTHTHFFWPPELHKFGRLYCGVG